LILFFLKKTLKTAFRKKTMLERLLNIFPGQVGHAQSKICRDIAPMHGSDVSIAKAQNSAHPDLSWQRDGALQRGSVKLL
jgi:hypothetical protein